MIWNPLKIVLVVALLAICQPQASYSRIVELRNDPRTGPISKTSNAFTEGLTHGAAADAYGLGLNRVRRNLGGVRPIFVVPQNALVRPKRRAEFIPFAYPGNDFERPKRQFRRPQFGFQQQYPGFGFQQQAGSNTISNQKFGPDGFFQNNGASSLGSNLATDGSSGQLSSANVNQDNSFTNGGYQGLNNAQSQSLNFDQLQQQAANANAGTKNIQNANGGRFEAQGGSQSTNNNPFGSSSNIANTNSAVYQDGDTRGSQADSSSQSIFQGLNGQNSAALTNSNVKSVQGPNGFVSNSASSNASAVSRGGQSAKAAASANSNSNSNGGEAFGNAGGFGGIDGAAANSGAFGNVDGAQGFANGQSGVQEFKIQKRRFFYYPQQRQKNQNQTSSSALEIINDSTEINWPKNSIQHYNHYPKVQQQQEKQQQPQQSKQLQLQQKHSTQQQLQQQHHYSSINPNSSTEQFAEIDENERHGRTFTFITDLINGLTQPTCVYPCTLEAYQQGRCCESFLVVPQPPPNICCQQPLPLLPPPPVIRPPVPIRPIPTNTYPLIPTQCCTTCPAYGYYGPPPCIRYTIPGGGPGRVTLYMG